jgi:microcystin degradation protein MlrC
MRIAIAGLFEEVNTFAVETMGLAKITGDFGTGFQKFEGQQILDVSGPGTNLQSTGFVKALREAADVEMLPGVFWMFGAGPTIEAATYLKMKRELLDDLKSKLPLDGVALVVHGAGVAEGVDCVEEDLLGAIRKLVGPTCKIASSTDHHSNLTQGAFEALDFLTVVKHYPHIDQAEAGYRSAQMLLALARGERKSHGHLERLPFLMQLLSTMEGNAYAPIRKQVEAYAARPGIDEFSLNYGFAFADVETNSASVNCWAASRALAEATAKEFAAWLWSKRASFVVKPLSAAEAVEKALALLGEQGRIEQSKVAAVISEPELLGRFADAGAERVAAMGFLPDDKARGPVVIAEMSDNPGCGAPGDATHVLWELLRRGVTQAAICSMRDPDTVKQAMAAGVGQTIDVTLGGKMSRSSGDPIRAKAYVKSISDGRYTNTSEMMKGAQIDVGPTVGLLIEGISVAVISGVMQAFDGRQMELVGFAPQDYRIVVVKSANHFRAWWTLHSHAIVDADPPGIASNNLSGFAYTKKRRKLYPLDPDASYGA